MVRVGNLPFRLCCLEYGADIVYSEELVDKKLLQTKPVWNEALQTLEFVEKKNEGRIVYSTNLKDTPTVLQMGTSDPDLALQAALHLYDAYDALDINMGCPKHFSVHSGMGASLLKTKQVAHDILKNLTRHIQDKPITCKIRLLDTMEETIDFVKTMESTGIAAITVHARYVPQRPRESAHLEKLQQIVKSVSIPVIANGDCFTMEDVEMVKQKTGCSSVMIARGAMWNPSIFGKTKNQMKMLPLYDVAKHYVEQSLYYESHPTNVKYVLMKMYEEVVGERAMYKKMLQIKGWDSICDLFSLPKETEKIQKVELRYKPVKTNKKQQQVIDKEEEEENCYEDEKSLKKMKL